MMMCRQHRASNSSEIESAPVPLDGTTTHLEVCRCGAVRVRVELPGDRTAHGEWTEVFDFGAFVLKALALQAGGE